MTITDKSPTPTPTKPSYDIWRIIFFIFLNPSLRIISIIIRSLEMKAAPTANRLKWKKKLWKTDKKQRGGGAMKV